MTVANSKRRGERIVQFLSHYEDMIDHLSYIHITEAAHRTGWSPIWSVIIRVITKSNDRALEGVRFVYHELDDTKSYYQFHLIIKITISEKRIAKL